MPAPPIAPGGTKKGSALELAPGLDDRAEDEVGELLDDEKKSDSELELDDKAAAVDDALKALKMELPKVELDGPDGNIASCRLVFIEARARKSKHTASRIFRSRD